MITFGIANSYMKLLRRSAKQQRRDWQKSVISYTIYIIRWRRGGLMVSALDSGASRPGSGPGRGHCVVFSTQVYKWVPANLMLGVALHPIPRGVEILLVA